MKTVTTLAVAALFALSAVPAFADEQDTLAERNSYLAAQAERAQASVRAAARRTERDVDAYAFQPAPRHGVDLSILSQH
jgi:hypothetical protein